VKANITRTATKKKRRLAALFFIFLTLFVAGSLFLAFNSLAPIGQSEEPIINPSSGPMAVIVDQLSLTYPNQTFVETAKNMLENAGYAVDYIPGENVTVNYYRNMPAYNYKIVILRVHAGIWPEMHSISFFTSETYSESKYTADQLSFYLGRAVFVNPPTNEEPGYFAITANFVKHAIKGSFNDTTVIMMGCYGLEYPSMAQAFIEKGTRVYIGWNGTVSAEHTDKATINLLKHLILEKQAVGQAVENTMKEIGEDPTYKSPLTYYPYEAKEQTIQDAKATTSTAHNGYQTWTPLFSPNLSEYEHTKRLLLCPLIPASAGNRCSGLDLPR
jgi:hypothetical protein